jgi:UDP-N-acetylglucosamine 2-epimerase (non-hydrolysing)
MVNEAPARHRVAIFVGTRPEGIKMAPVIRALAADPDIEPIVISSGQHRELLQQVVDLFDFEVTEDLMVMRPAQSLAELTVRLMTGIDDFLGRFEPDMVLVQGDTTTVLVAALASFYRKIPVGHVEAGLRTGNIWSPFPEEANRTLATPLVSLHFPPTTTARDNLLREGVPADSVFVTGNTVIDALQMEISRQVQPAVAAEIRSSIEERLGADFGTRRFVLVTGHRRENFGGGFLEICDALGELGDRFPDTDFVYPVHLNPNVQGPVYERLSGRSNVKLIAPVPYSEFVALLASCTVVLTDSGGVQEEAPSLGKPVLVMRDTTERPEGVASGTVKLTGAERASIVREVTVLLSDPVAYQRMAAAVNPYGDGRAASRILEAIRDFLHEHDSAT